jgi:pimeloyl-ACP methyl ester carboxylesterase
MVPQPAWQMVRPHVDPLIAYTPPPMFSFRLGLLLLLLAVVIGPAAVVAVIALQVVATFIIAAIHAGPRPAGTGLSGRARIGLWGREIVTAWLIMLCTMPFERWLMRRDLPGTGAGLPPVLLIHGYINNAGAMFVLWRTLRRAGYPVHTLNLEPVYTSIDDYAGLIEARVTAVSGARRVVLVCHSMGGLAVRAWMRSHGAARVDRLITLGTPHHGTAHARFGAGRNARQMEPESPWLRELASGEAGRWPCPVTSIYSLDDNIVAPARSAHLDGARNIVLAGVGHMSLPMSGAVAREVARLIEEVPVPRDS